MAKRKIELTDDQKQRNLLILAKIESERDRLFDETRALQQQFRRNIKRKRSKSHSMLDGEYEYDD
ncbi:MAG TPA: hypothetical protein VFI27_17540 [candidate division Zixibacteria bacterium]|nr:hypothetical protein [candidate division Zixibacteria bacterium]